MKKSPLVVLSLVFEIKKPQGQSNPTSTKNKKDEGVEFYESPDGFHRHKCDCGNIWEHSDSCKGQKEPHICTQCGEIEGSQYFGPEAPTTTTI